MKSKGINSLLTSIGRSLRKEYTTDAGKVNITLVLGLILILAVSVGTNWIQNITNFVSGFFGREPIELLPPYLIPWAFVSIVVIGVWCVRSVSKVETVKVKNREAE